MKTAALPIMVAKAIAVVIVTATAVGCAQPARSYVQQSLVIRDEDGFRQAVLEHDRPSIVKFSTTQCGPCRELAPLFESLAEQHEEKVLFASVDTNKLGKLADRYHVWRIPTVIAFRHGKEVGRLTGLHSRGGYEQMIEALGASK